jgi:hypothetical protein
MMRLLGRGVASGVIDENAESTGARAVPTRWFEVGSHASSDRTVAREAPVRKIPRGGGFLAARTADQRDRRRYIESH